MYEYEDGDGTVNIRSLESCKKWLTEQKQLVHTQGFEGAEHMGVLSDQRVLEYIKAYISCHSTNYL